MTRALTADPTDQATTRRVGSRCVVLIVLCLGELMIVLDTTIVNVALPSIRSDLAFSETSLAWVVNGYTLSFGGFLLIAGGLADLYGPRRWFGVGVAAFTGASLLCGLSGTEVELIAARAVQGLGGAIVAATSMSLTISLFIEASERTRAMAVLGFITAGGGSIGVLTGGVLTEILDWHWIFFLNVPVGIAACIAARSVLPEDPRSSRPPGRLDIAGAVLATAALTIAVYAVVGVSQHGRLTPLTVGLFATALGLAAGFVIVETRSHAPLLSRRLVGAQNFVLANGIAVLWAAALFAWFFFSALYLQLVLGYSPIRVGLAFLPASVVMAIVSLRFSGPLVSRFGNRVPLSGGLILAAAGLLVLARAPASANYLADMLPAMLLFGVAGGIVFNPLLLAATNHVPAEDAGVASGVVNSSFMMGGALSLGCLATVSSARAASLTASGHHLLVALNGGYHLAFVVAGALCVVACGLATGLDGQSRPAKLPVKDATDDAQKHPPASPIERNELTMGRPVVHFEIISPDPSKLRTYYATLFGWEFHVGDAISSNVSEPAMYGFIDGATTGDGTGINGGIGGGPQHHARVLFYVAVDEVESALQAAERLGGTRLLGPDPGEGTFTIGQFVDPAGNTIGVAGPSAR